MVFIYQTLMHNDLHKAIRNKRILAWFKALPLIGKYGVVTRSSVVVFYAKALDCPVCEISYDMEDQDSLDFLYKNYAKEIDQT